MFLKPLHLTTLSRATFREPLLGGFAPRPPTPSGGLYTSRCAFTPIIAVLNFVLITEFQMAIIGDKGQKLFIIIMKFETAITKVTAARLRFSHFPLACTINELRS